jgi:hypothetical protein
MSSSEEKFVDQDSEKQVNQEEETDMVKYIRQAEGRITIESWKK